MRWITYCVACLLVAGIGSLTVSQDKPAPKPKERQAVELADRTYDEEIAAAETGYKEALERAKKKMLASYDAAITSALKRGGEEGLDLANALNAEKKTFQQLESKGDDAKPSMRRENLSRSLSAKTWYWHWEQPNRDVPIRIQLDAPKPKWKAELRWVLTDGAHILIPIDDFNLRGFFVATGRQVGAFADKKDKK